MPGRSLKAMPSGNGRKRDNAYFNFNSEEAVRLRNMAATQNFLDRLRDEIKFPSVDALREQIAQDVKKARRYFHLLKLKTKP